MPNKKISTERNYWNEFYLENSKNTLFSIPSQFCCLTATEISSDLGIAEFGCGNGRDSIFFARHGFNIVAMDVSTEAIKQNNHHCKDFDNISFHCGDVSVHEDVNMLLEAARKISKTENILVYSRFFLHSLDTKQEASFMECLSKNLKTGDQIYFEFRTEKDTDTKKIYENHFRRFVDFKEYSQKLTEYGFDINYELEGVGMAKYKNEDPTVARFIAVKK